MPWIWGEVGDLARKHSIVNVRQNFNLCATGLYLHKGGHCTIITTTLLFTHLRQRRRGQKLFESNDFDGREDHVYPRIGKGRETHHYNKRKSLALYRPVDMVVWWVALILWVRV